MKIALATDHAGFEAAVLLQDYITSLGHVVSYYGPESFDADDDYPDYIFPAAHSIADGVCDRAIILGGSGQGEAMAANRLGGVRAAVFYAPAISEVPVDADGTTSDSPYEIVRLSRLHNDANVLSLSGRFLSIEQMRTAVKLWLETTFSGEERHVRRIQKLDNH